MGEFKDRSDRIYEMLVEELEQEGFESISDDITNKIIDLIRDEQLENPEEFKKLVKDAIDIINN